LQGPPWRLVASRSRSDPLVIVAAWIVIVAATTLLAAAVMYSDAVGRSGLLGALLRAGPQEVAVQVASGGPV
jgi:hypothetical protein